MIDACAFGPCLLSIAKSVTGTIGPRVGCCEELSGRQSSAAALLQRSSDCMTRGTSTPELSKQCLAWLSCGLAGRKARNLEIRRADLDGRSRVHRNVGCTSRISND